MIAGFSRNKRIACSNSGGKTRDRRVEQTGVAAYTGWSNVERTTISPPKDHCTYYDSGATTHVFHCKDAFVKESLRDCEPRTVLLADKSPVTASKCGEVLLPFEYADIRLKSVLFIPGLGYNLVSVGRMADNGIESLFRKKDVMLRHQEKEFVVGFGTRDDETRLYLLPSPEATIPNVTALTTESETSLWHQRLAHMNIRDMCEVHKHTDGVPKLGVSNVVCRACRLGKAHKLPFKGEFRRAKHVGDVIHSDIVGPIEMSYLRGYRYFVTFQDDCSRYNFVEFMQRKSDLASVFLAFLRRLAEMGGHLKGTLNVHQDELHTFAEALTYVKKLHSDQAKEYLRLDKTLGQSITNTYSPPYTPELNAIAERVNRTIEDASRSMLIQANLPTCLWPFAVKQVAYIRNRVKHSTTNKPPYLTITGERPDLKYARVFGCAAYVLKLPRMAKFDARAQEGIMLEIMNYGVYKLLVKDSNGMYSIVESRHVTFDESNFPGVPELNIYMDKEEPEDDSWSEDDADGGDSHEMEEVVHDEISLYEGSDDEVDVSNENDEGSTSDGDFDDDTGYIDAEDRGSVPATTEYEDNNPQDIEDFVDKGGDDDGKSDEEIDQTPHVSDSLRTANPTVTHRYPRRNRRPPSAWFMSASSTEARITTGDDPTLSEALSASPEEREAWLHAIDEEFQSIEENDTWEFDDSPDGMPLPTHMVLNIKRDATGKVDRFKARLVAGGNHQVYGQNYLETYAPVVDFSLVRIFLYIVLSLGMFIAQVDIKTAFLNGALEEAIWVMSPRNIPGRPSRLYKLKKALYGLKQAHLAWHKRLCADLLQLNFHELSSAPCVFRRKYRGFYSFILVYVDD